MKLTEQQINSFIECWQKDFGETLSIEAAEAEAMRLLDFFTQMDEMLRSQRAFANKASRPPTPGSKEGGAKMAWQRVMRRRN